ncbi:hypothetical protein FHC49_11840 [Kluyvera sp. EC_51]|uniref:hypothetical protein n=1 Tax=Kluyvera sp. EC_51 TaxID=2584089 RepID=UPI001C70661C|nr:hypothetical protein [Kluyvera sp. EC_51]MBW9462026.1 hypothetical protein [Kluyvera sp. EC_51]
MSEQQIDRLVAQILQRLQPPVLVMVTAADGYRQAIRQRLAGCGQRLVLAMDETLEDAAAWHQLGEVLPLSGEPPMGYKALLLPFLDYPQAADLVNGTLHSPVARRLHEALLAGIPVLALRYHCCPHSELNQLRGAVIDSAYTAHIDATLARLAACGVTLCTMNELLEKLTTGVTAPAPAPLAATRRYLTVTDIVNNPSLAARPDVVLTDAAVDYVKTKKK